MADFFFFTFVCTCGGDDSGQFNYHHKFIYQVKSLTDTRDVKLASEMHKYVEYHKQPIRIKYYKEGCLKVIITKWQQHCNVFSS